MSTLLAVVPARAASKRLPQKNRRPLAGAPLLAWTLSAARKSQCFRRIIVSTEDPEIMALALQHGGEVPWLRPAALAADDVRTPAVCADVVARLAEQGEDYDGLMLLQPTSPFRSASTIRAAVDLFDGGTDSVVSVSAATHPNWYYRISEDGLLHPWVEGAKPARAQDLEPAYRVNGAIYLVRTSVLTGSGSFYGPRTRALRMDDPVEALDVDTPFDWQVAEAFADQLVGERLGPGT